MAKKHDRLCLHIDLNEHGVLPAALEILNWLDEHGIKVLNVGGPRASKDAKIYKVVKEILETLLSLNASVDRIFTSLRFSKTASDEKIRKPATVDEAVDRLLSEMNLKDLNKVARMSEDDLIDLHFTVGMWIRNNFVYPRNDKLLQSCRVVSRDKFLHFAQMHMVIIRELWKKLQKSHKLKVVK
jgi:hypothetical protein